MKNLIQFKKYVVLFTFLFNIFSYANETSVKLALNWKPEPEFGGFYEAAPFYKKAGYNVEIIEGGSATPTAQLLINEKVEFAILSAEEILLNNDRDPQRKLIAVFSVFEKSPYMIMSHENQNYKTLSDLFKDKEATISLQKGLPYVDYLIHKFTPIQAKLVPYTGGVGLFEKNEKMAQQGFITSEYLIAQNLKIKSKAWLVADEGFNPYIATLAVREKYLKKNPELVKKIVEATREGWLQYLKSPQTTNRLMNQKNPSMSFEMMNLSLKKMKDFMVFAPLQLGQMNKERWNTLGSQLVDLKLIKQNPQFGEYFQNF